MTMLLKWATPKTRYIYHYMKELLFVKRIDMHGVMEEEVYEMAHL
jgi:hypothetical protein